MANWLYLARHLFVFFKLYLSEGVCGPSVISFTLKGGCLEMPHLVWQQDGSMMAARWKQSGSILEAKWSQSEVLGYMCLLTKEVPHEEYKRGPVSMKDQDSLWIINTLDWYYKFSKSIVISVFYPFLLLLLSTQSLRRLCQTLLTSDPSLPTRAALIQFTCDQHLVCEDLTTLAT